MAILAPKRTSGIPLADVQLEPPAVNLIQKTKCQTQEKVAPTRQGTGMTSRPHTFQEYERGQDFVKELKMLIASLMCTVAAQVVHWSFSAHGSRDQVIPFQRALPLKAW